MSEHEDKFQHLTEEQLETLHALYMGGANVTELLAVYAIDLSPNLFARHFPPHICEGLLCPACQLPMYQRRRARSTPRGASTSAFCKACEHRHFFPGRNRSLQSCPCAHCHANRVQARQRQEARLRQQIHAEHSLESLQPVHYNSLELTEKLWLMALLEARLDWRLGCLVAPCEAGDDRCVSPTPRLDLKLLDALRKARILVVDPDSPVDAFERGAAPQPRLDKARWRVNVGLGDEPRAEASLREELGRGPLPAWREQIDAVLHELAVEEVLGYVELRCAATQYPFTALNKAREIILELLRHLPVCKIWYLAFLAHRKAVMFANECSVPRAHASNSIPNAMLNSFRKSVEQRWNIEWDRHSSRTPRSTLSMVLHDLLLKHDDFGRERTLAEYLEQLPITHPLNDVPVAVGSACTACGSLAVHVQALPQALVINCKDCMARSVLAGSPCTPAH